MTISAPVFSCEASTDIPSSIPKSTAFYYWSFRFSKLYLIPQTYFKRKLKYFTRLIIPDDLKSNIFVVTSSDVTE